MFYLVTASYIYCAWPTREDIASGGDLLGLLILAIIVFFAAIPFFVISGLLTKKSLKESITLAWEFATTKFILFYILLMVVLMLTAPLVFGGFMVSSIVLERFGINLIFSQWIIALLIIGALLIPFVYIAREKKISENYSKKSNDEN
jgi:hypothetical protein